MRARATFIAITLFVLTGPAQAMGVTWTFQNALFDDGTPLTGSFMYDSNSALAGGYSNVDVHTQAFGGMSGAHYTSVTPLSSGIEFTARDGDQTLGILFDEWIGIFGDPGNTVGVEGGEASWGTISLGFLKIPVIEAKRHLVSGYLTAALGDAVSLIEPTTLVLFLLGVTLLLVLRRRAII